MLNPKAHVEAEVKFEITLEERNEIEKILKESGLIKKGTKFQSDIIFDIQKSPANDYDFKRIRLEGIPREVEFEVIGETKTWVRGIDGWVREEREFPVTRLNKLRTTYTTDGLVVDIDMATIGDQTRHFIEVEMLVSHDEAEEAYKRVEAYAREHFNLGDRKKSPPYTTIIAEEL